MAEFTVEIEISKCQAKDRIATVTKAFESLNPGQKMQLINDHEMSPLLNYFFKVNYPDQFEAEYLEQGPQVWRIAITKKIKTHIFLVKLVELVDLVVMSKSYYINQQV